MQKLIAQREQDAAAMSRTQVQAEANNKLMQALYAEKRDTRAEEDQLNTVRAGYNVQVGQSIATVFPDVELFQGTGKVSPDSGKLAPFYSSLQDSITNKVMELRKTSPGTVNAGDLAKQVASNFEEISIDKNSLEEDIIPFNNINVLMPKGALQNEMVRSHLKQIITSYKDKDPEAAIKAYIQNYLIPYAVQSIH